MAKLHEEVIVLKVSQHLKDDQPESQLLGPEISTSLEQVIAELVQRPNVMVEVESIPQGGNG